MKLFLGLLLLVSANASRPDKHQRFLEVNRSKDPPHNYIMNILSHRSIGYLDTSNQQITYQGESTGNYDYYNSIGLSKCTEISFHRKTPSQNYYALQSQSTTCGHFVSDPNDSKYHFDMAPKNIYLTLDQVKHWLTDTFAGLANGWGCKLIFDFNGNLHGGYFDQQPLPDYKGSGSVEFFNNVQIISFGGGYYLYFERGNQKYLGIIDTLSGGIHGSFTVGDNNAPYSFDAAKSGSAHSYNDITKFNANVLVPVGYTGTLQLSANAQGLKGTISLGNEGSENLTNVQIIQRFGAFYLYFERSKNGQLFYGLFETGSQGNTVLALHGHFWSPTTGRHPFDAEGFDW